MAVHVQDAKPMAAGVDPSTGRFYTLTPDTCAFRAGGGALPIRGGLKMADARLDPVPAIQNVLPELAYNSNWRIPVDPVTHRVFVRRGIYEDGFQLRYPECDLQKRELAPQEFFYRVYEDGIPVAQAPPGLNDASLTTDVDEEPGVTEASFLGSGSGYGARTLLVGGADALADGNPTKAQSACGADDREVLAGSVGKVEVSDQSTAAEAAGLDADGRTQEAAADPASRCRPQPKAEQVGADNAERANHCYGDVHEGAFDQSKPGVDDNHDGCDDRDGTNRYAAECIGAEHHRAPGYDAGDTEHVPGARDGFDAGADCDGPHEKASASAAAAGGSNTVDQAAGGPVRVARAASEVTVVRKAGKGVTVKVDSVARGIELPGVGTIGVVRAEATSTATGRDGRAFATFTRTICDVHVQGLVVTGCLGDDEAQQSFVAKLNDALGGRATVRLRKPDGVLARGTPHGYLAALQRDREELFSDQVIARDRSLAVPALEVLTYQGDGGDGSGRQIVQLAGVQASTSYGIVCSYGRKVDGSCGSAGDPGQFPGSLDGGAGYEPFGDGGGGGSATLTGLDGADPAAAALSQAAPRENLLTRVLRAVPRALAEALRLLFNNPRELGLLAALWGLLYAPCYLGDRRRAVRTVAGHRLTAGAT
jgi:hypothetical protein